jgi:hypothetical protein
MEKKAFTLYGESVSISIIVFTGKNSGFMIALSTES